MPSCFKIKKNRLSKLKIYPLLSQFRHNHLRQPFGVYNICLFDNGRHGDDVRNFARTVLPPDTNLKQINVEQNPNEPDLKQVDGLLHAMRKINDLPPEQRPDYLLIPVLIGVPLLNLTDQMKSVCGGDVYLTPENIKENKPKILDFLKKISEEPEKYREYIDYLDPLGLKIEYTYPLLEEIKKAKQNGIRVYIPAGHPEYQSIKYLTERDNLKPELYHYLSTGEDINGRIKQISDYIKQNNWYEFNLLELADAEIIKLLDADGKQHLYSSYDNLETNAKRGIYNFYPVRKNGKIAGYSFTDKITVQYPESGYMQRLSALTKYVGLKKEEVLADRSELESFKNYLKNQEYGDNTDFKNKLFKIEDVFDENTINQNKLRLKGKFVDSSLQLYFDVNNQDEIIFKNCDYERSGRPSVKSMFGACFSTCNALADEIKDTESIAAKTEDSVYKSYLKLAEYNERYGKGELALELYQRALDYKKQQLLLRNVKKNDLSIFIKDELNLAKTCNSIKKYEEAEKHYKKAAEIAMQNNSTSDIIKLECISGLGQTLFNLGKINEANQFIDLAMETSNKKTSPFAISAGAQTPKASVI